MDVGKNQKARTNERLVWAPGGCISAEENRWKIGVLKLYCERKSYPSNPASLDVVMDGVPADEGGPRQARLHN